MIKLLLFILYLIVSVNKRGRQWLRICYGNQIEYWKAVETFQDILKFAHEANAQKLLLVSL